MAHSPTLALLLALPSLTLLHGVEPIASPGFRPRPVGSHALVGARVFTKPGSEFTQATILIRDNRITAVGIDVRVPADARVWDLTGSTIYAGFIDPYVLSGSNTAPVNTRGTEPVGAAADQLTAGLGTGSDPRFLGVPGQERDAGGTGPGSAIPDVTPERRLALTHSPDPKILEGLREIGFTAANFAPGRGLIRGQSVVASLGESGPNASILRADTAQHVSLAPESGSEGYPNSLMGGIAVLRQTWFDARWQANYQTSSIPNRSFNTAYDALQPTLRKQSPQPVVAEPGSVLMASRALVLAAELGWNLQIVASGQEWRRPDLLQNCGVPFIVPLAFPSAPKLPSPDDWDAIPLDLLRQWDWAPENPAVLRRAGADIALTTHGIPDRKEFRKNLRFALARGLSEVDALAALTTVPARLCGLGDHLGTIESGRIANLTIVRGSYFDPETPIQSVWIDGTPYELPPPKSASNTNAPAKPAKPDAHPARLAADPRLHHGPITNPPAVLVRNATVWTSGAQGTLTNAALFVRNGLIESVGAEPATLPAGTLVIDAAGKHVSPGLLDCHSHSMILGSVNEATLPSTAMVRIADVVNSETDNIHQQLAGGLTIANLLHGSANPIGGQNCVIKLRDGAGPDALRFTNAPGGIKFALGENVKQGNSGDRNTTRFPQTRMGVGTFFINRFTAGRQYREARLAWEASDRSTPPPRRDLELEAIAEILAGTRLIHCHSYRQDEILAFLRTMEAFGVRVASLQHILEGYKVADEIARHGAGASAFSDWWAYKFEVIDAIPYAGSLLHQRGVNVSFNSDSSDHARRLNLEAAKAVKYGNTPEADALRFVTLNPAKQLGIDRWVGSLEPGKHADFVLWSASPLDSASVCLQTWIEGTLYFDRALVPARVAALQSEKKALVARARSKSDSPPPDPAAGGSKAEAARALFFQRALEHARHLGVVECQDCFTNERY
jgi:imidazolonepropionase-like amidohydrolase